MDHLAEAKQRMAADKIRKSLDDISAATEAQLSGVKDHIHFTLQQAYFKCAFECFDRTKSQEEIDNCVEYCSVPVLKAHYLVEDETANLTEKMRRALMVCQDKFLGAEQKEDDALKVMESCLEVSVQHFSKTLPHIVRELKTSLGIESKD